MRTYGDIKQAIGTIIGTIPMFFAFNHEQFEQGLEKLGCTKEELVGMGGGYMKASDGHLFKAANEEVKRIRMDYLSTDSGLLSAIRYELSNHEYGYTYDAQPALDALDLDRTDERVARALKQACADCLRECEA